METQTQTARKREKFAFKLKEHQNQENSSTNLLQSECKQRQAQIAVEVEKLWTILANYSNKLPDVYSTTTNCIAAFFSSQFFSSFQHEAAELPQSQFLFQSLKKEKNISAK